jgi:hypothetical protein
VVTHRSGAPHVIWSRNGPILYRECLAAADLVVVTADSMSMTSEACVTGRPVSAFMPDGGSPKFLRFHNGLHELGVTRELPALPDLQVSWTRQPLDAVPRIAAEVARRFEVPSLSMRLAVLARASGEERKVSAEFLRSRSLPVNVQPAVAIAHAPAEKAGRACIGECVAVIEARGGDDVDIQPIHHVRHALRPLLDMPDYRPCVCALHIVLLLASASDGPTSSIRRGRDARML